MISSRATIHIGLMKAASTTLQRVWAASTEIDLIHPQLAPWMKDVRARDWPKARTDFERIVRTNVSDRLPIIVSHESLNALARDKFAEIVSGLFQDVRFLVITRNPIDYARSLYQKNIRSGYPGSITDFVRDRMNSLRRTFDLDGMAAAYRAAGVETCFTPFELLSSGRADAFYSSVGKTVGAEAKPASEDFRANRTASFETLELARLSNAIHHALFETANPAALNEYKEKMYQWSSKLHESDLDERATGKFRPLLTTEEQFQKDITNAEDALQELTSTMSVLKELALYEPFLGDYKLA